MCLRCAELEDEVRFLKRELNMEIDQNKIGRLQTTLAITPHQARILFAIYSARGRIVTPDALEDMIPAVNGDMRETLQVFKVQVCKMRRAIGRDVVETVWGKGYRISDLGRLVVEEAFEARRAA